MENTKSFLSKNLIHFIVISYLLLENATVYIWGSKAPIVDLVLFNLLDLSYFYGTTYILLEKVNNTPGSLMKKALFCLLIILIYAILVFTLVIILTNYRGMPIPNTELTKSFFKTFFRRCTFFLFSLGFWHSRQNQKKQKIILDHEREANQKRENELRMEAALLRSQLDPHMVINTLTGLQAYLVEKAPEATRILLLISDILKSNIRSSQKNGFIILSSEIEVINKVIELNEMLGKKVNYQLNASSDRTDLIELPPNLLVTLVENVFKHGSFSNQEEIPIISICLEDRLLTYSSINQPAPDNKKGLGIGLENIKSQLELYFPKRYTLIEHKDDSLYSISVQINFSNN